MVFPRAFQKIQNEEHLEIPLEVQEKIACTTEHSRLIAEQEVCDLEYVSIADSKYFILKRILDIILSVIGLAVVSIPLLIILLIVCIDDPGSPIFSQYRVGAGGHRFKLYKLRTMRNNTPKYMSTNEVEDPDKYITHVGRILRRFSVDELPQLVNVIKGDMSIVGPRPLISDEHEIHHLRMKYGVYNVRPGLTGLAQIHGRDLVKPADKVRWDVHYLECFGFWTDLKIVLLTIPKLFGGDGVAEGYKHFFDEKKKEMD